MEGKEKSQVKERKSTPAPLPPPRPTLKCEYCGAQTHLIPECNMFIANYFNFGS